MNDNATPAPLKGEVWLTLHTTWAQRMVTGSPANESRGAIPGLRGFAKRTRTICQAATADDPYADWWLIQIEEAVASASEELGKTLRYAAAVHEGMRGMSVEVAASARPAKVPMLFMAPHPYQVGRLIGEYDYLARSVLSLRRAAALPDELERAFGFCGSRLRHVLLLAHQYKALGITRKDVRDNIVPAQKARGAMGDVPEEVVEKRVSPRFQGRPPPEKAPPH